MKRGKSLIASIFGLIVIGAQLVVNLYSLYVLWAVLIFSSAMSENLLFAWTIFSIAALIEIMLIVTFILICVSFSCVNASPEKYQKRKSLLVTIVVFNFLMALLCVWCCFNNGEQLVSMWAYVVSAVILVLCNILYLVDMKQEKRRVANMTANTNQDNNINENNSSIENQ